VDDLPSIRRPGDIHSSRAHFSLTSQKLTTCTGQRRSRTQEQLLPVLPQINSSALHGIRSSSFQALAELINPRERRPGCHIMCDSPGVRRFGLHGALVPL
jgi:hypothetical protein